MGTGRHLFPISCAPSIIWYWYSRTWTRSAKKKRNSGNETCPIHFLFRKARTGIPKSRILYTHLALRFRPCLGRISRVPSLITNYNLLRCRLVPSFLPFIVPSSCWPWSNEESCWPSWVSLPISVTMRTRPLGIWTWQQVCATNELSQETRWCGAQVSFHVDAQAPKRDWTKTQCLPH